MGLALYSDLNFLNKLSMNSMKKILTMIAQMELPHLIAFAVLAGFVVLLVLTLKQ